MTSPRTSSRMSTVSSLCVIFVNWSSLAKRSWITTLHLPMKKSFRMKWIKPRKTQWMLIPRMMKMIQEYELRRMVIIW
ncbi:unnamed protein product [Leptidea sinapis]|uniref:Uncharacterized protein n=1 Tax=Leptidea sinapis TaxID=189913 RepID=A0A5E4QAZ2_9NEOP|nr:unnamed protein product [Leptidea sinapis]